LKSGIDLELLSVNIEDTRTECWVQVYEVMHDAIL